jgi:hypothetical protein
VLDDIREEAAMAKTTRNRKRNGQLATHDDLVHVLGEIDVAKAADILALRPTLAELVEAGTRLTGDETAAGPEPHQPKGTVAEILNILAVEEEADEI